MRVSWYADTGIAVFSIWQGGTCTGTFRLPIPELPRMIEALRKGPPGRGAQAHAAPGPDWQAAEPTRVGADPGPPTAAIDMAPELAPDVPAARGPGGDYPPDYAPPRPERERPQVIDPLNDPSYAAHQGPEQDAGYLPGPAHGGYQDFPPAAETQAAASYREPPGPHYEDRGPEAGYRDIPPAGYDRPAPGGGYSDAPPGGGYGDAEPGYRDESYSYGEAPRGSDYGDFASAADDFGPADHEPSGGYQDSPRDPFTPRHQGTPPGAGEPAPAGYAAHAPGAQEARRPPTGPLPVGRWQGDQGGQYPAADALDSRSGPPGGYGGRPEPDYGRSPEPDYGQSHEPDYGRSPEPGYGTGPEPGYGRSPEPDYGRSHEPDYGQSHEPDYGRNPEPDYGGSPEPGYGGHPDAGYGQGEPDGAFGFDPLGSDYTGEAEQGYLPGPPTETFRPVPPVSGYTGQASRHGAPPSGPDDGYGPRQDDADEASAYSLRGRSDGLPSESFAYHPGHTESPDHEYRSSRRRS